MSVDLTRAIKSLRPDADFILEDDSITWTDTVLTEPTAEEISAERVRLNDLDNSLAYSRTRKAKYDLLNQDEMRYDDVKNSTTTWVDAIDAIKVAHPKP